MANQIIKKFIQDGAIDGDKIQLLVDQGIKGKLQDGTTVDLIKLDGSDKVLVKGVEVGLKSQIDQALVDAEAYADQKISDLVNGAPIALDTLKEIADQLASDQTALSGILTTLDTKAATTYVDAEVQAAKDYADTQIAAIPAVDLSAIEGDIATLQSDLGIVESDVATLQGQMSTAEGEIDTLQGEMVAAQGDISSLQSDVSTAQSDISTLQSDVVGLVAKDVVLEKRQSFLKTSLYNDFAPSYSNGKMGVQDPVEMAGNALVRDGWYFQNTDASDIIGWYFFDANTAKMNQTKSGFNAFTVMTLDTVGAAGAKPIIGLYSYPTGVNDAYPGYFHSRWTYILSDANLASLVAGKKYLFYVGDVAPDVHPELEKIKLDYAPISSVGEKGESEVIGFASINSDTTTVGKVNWLVESCGVEADNAKIEVELRIKKALKSELDAEIQNRIDGDAAALQDAKDYADAQIAAIPAVDLSGKADITYVDAQDAQVLQDAKDYADAAVLVEKNRAEGVEGFLTMTMSLQENRLTTAEGKITVLEGEMDTAQSDISALQSDVSTLQSDVTALQNASVLTYEKEAFVASSPLTDISLSHEAIEKSLVVFVGRLALHAGEDYTVSVVGGVTKLTWAGDFAVGGVEGIEAGDLIKVTYAYMA